MDPQHPTPQGGQPPPTPDQLAAMAFADGELAPEEREAFERRIPHEPELAEEVSRYRRLEMLARQLAPPEPAELAWEQLATEPLHRAGVGGGFALLAFGVVGLLGWACLALALTDAIPLTAKLAVGAGLSGLLLVFLTLLRARLRALPHDPYTAVRR